MTRFLCNPKIRFASLRPALLGLGLWAVIGLALPAQAQIAFTGVAYTQNFDTLASTGTNLPFTNNTTLLGWYAGQTTYSADNGSSNSVSMYSYGSTGSTDRALGGLTGGTNFTYAAQFQNTSGGTINLNTVTLEYTMEQWRKQNNAAQTMQVDYLVSASNANLIAAGGYTLRPTLNTVSPTTGGGAATALDGNLAANQVFAKDILSATSTAWNNGDYLWVRWTQVSANSNDQGMSLDRVSLGVIPEPTTVPLVALGGLALLGYRRFRRH